MSTILLVDDDKTFLHFVCQTLTMEGYRCLEATGGKEAQQILSNTSTDISAVLLDWNMPEMNGLEVLKWIREQPHLEPIQVILQTANNEPEYIREGIDAGAFYYLVKPCPREMLLSTVKAAIQDYQRQRELLSKLNESENSFRLLEEGTFRFKTISEGDFLAIRIANISTAPQDAMYVSELFCNAVEHGNLNISYDEKTRLIDEGKLKEEVEKRLSQPEFKEKYVKVRIKKSDDELEVLIEDEGYGFDYQKYLSFDNTRIFDNHGRGIAICNSYLKLHYFEKGNKVLVKLPVKNFN